MRVVVRRRRMVLDEVVVVLCELWSKGLTRSSLGRPLLRKACVCVKVCGWASISEWS